MFENKTYRLKQNFNWLNQGNTQSSLNKSTAQISVTAKSTIDLA